MDERQRGVRIGRVKNVNGLARVRAVSNIQSTASACAQPFRFALPARKYRGMLRHEEALVVFAFQLRIGETGRAFTIGAAASGNRSMADSGRPTLYASRPVEEKVGWPYFFSQ